MKNIHTFRFFTILQFFILIFCVCSTYAQVEFRYLPGFGTALYDINDSGQAIQRGGVYSFATNSVTIIDTPATSLVGINNNGDLIGNMPIVISGTTLDQPAYKKNGTWYPMGYFAGATDQASAYQGQISENGNYITGQMSIDCCNSQAFLYNVSTSSLEEISDPANEYSAGYTVNDDGILGGWFDPLPAGTLRVPAYMTTGSVITSVPAALPTLSSVNAVNAINNSNLMAGDRDGVPFIFDLTTNTFTAYQVPAGYESATFTSISENGIAVGYCQITFPNIIRDAIIYHPSLGSQPVLISRVLANHGITVTSTIDSLLGTAIAISPDGNFVCGWENSFVAFASGWIINFSDSLTSDCYITCPQDIYDISLTGSKIINYSIPITCNAHPGASLVLVSGLASGSALPIGSTVVVHNLVDTNGTLLNTCSFTVELTDTYCNPSNLNNTGEPITLVNLADINNVSSESATMDYEDFTSIVGNVEIDSAYTATFKGYTGGTYTNFFRVFIDWNQDGVFDDQSESYDMGSVSNSSGIDTIETSGTVLVPTAALTGLTTMRVIKNYDAYTANACVISSGFGQTEDYTMNVSSNPTGIENIKTSGIKLYPNPVNDQLNFISSENINSISILNLTGQEVLQSKINTTSGQVNVSALPKGIYILKIFSTGVVKTFKINKL